MNEQHPQTPPEEPSSPSPPPVQEVAVRLPSQKPIITYVLMGVSVAIYFLQAGSEYLLGVDVPAVYGMKINEMIAAGQLWRLLTPIFLHGSVLHIGFNMYALYLFGPALESRFGRARFLILYMLSGFAGNVISMMFTPQPSLGSSTAIFGLLGAQGVYLYQNRRIFGGQVRRALNSIISVAVVNLIIGLSPQIDNWGHIGGLLGGVLFTWFAGPILDIGGVYPELRLEDTREQGDILRATIVVGAFFVILALGTIYIWQQ